MKKGITPIIAIIILLLITIALAGSAYSFLSTYFTSATGKAIQLADAGYCLTGNQAIIVLQNIGTQRITFTGCTGVGAITGDSKTCDDITVTRVDGGAMIANFTADSSNDYIDPQEFVTFRDSGCTGFCQYRFRSAGSAVGAIQAQVSC